MPAIGVFDVTENFLDNLQATQRLKPFSVIDLRAARLQGVP